jgi:hypothetical protein
MAKPKTIASKDLKAFLNTSKRETRLMGAVERHVLSKPFDERDMSYIHPSDIIKEDWCALAQYHAVTGNYTETRDKTTARLASIFEEGHTIHAKWQNWFQEMGVLHGKFRCLSCLEITWGTSPEECGKCGWKTLEYAEVTLVDEELRIAGHTDGWIKGIGDDCLIEIKSIGPGTIRSEAPNLMMDADGDFMKAWNSVRKPFGPHVLQGQLYLELMKRMGNDVNEIVFLYELKADQSYKEFSVKADYELVRHVFDGAKVVVDAVNANEVPECSNQPGGVCKQCAPYKEK